jgi:membrane protease YdiL (CAAX protease family)
LGELNRLVEFPPVIEKWMRAQEDEAAKTMKVLLSRHTISDLLLNLVFVAGLAAVGEELLFRGILQRILIRWFRSPWAGIIVTAILFSAMHVQFYGFLPRLVLGILLGALYWYSGSLWTAIIAHFAYDALLIVLVYMYPHMLNDEATADINTLILPTLLSLTATIILFIWMKRNSRTVYPEVYADDAIPVKDHPF